MSHKITFVYLVIYQSIEFSSVRKNSIYEGTFSQVYKTAKHFCPKGFVIRDIRVA